jgi:selenobiotic family peptide radical SAM maturase
MKEKEARPPYGADLGTLKESVLQAERLKGTIPGEVEGITVNPTLQVLQLAWKNLTALLEASGDASPAAPERGEELLFVWFDPVMEKVRVEKARDADLLALKVVVEGLDPVEAAKAAGRPVGIIDVAVSSAARRGIMLMPPSKIRRDPAAWQASAGAREEFLVSRGFTLQWHITQACDLHCRHCYDRSSRKMVPLDRALGILDDLRDFCRRRFVTGHVSFTGGNPLLHPHFYELYRAASDRGFTMSVLGNPASREEVEKIVAIERPYVYQVSLEGLEEHNDSIRGEGHFRSVMEFLPLLKERGVSSMVMLTLTEGNIDQILPLAERLEGLAESFFFNRLSAVGEGAALRLPSKERYESFLEEFVERAEKSSTIGLKDNLINILRHRRGEPLFGGCTGFGCGAAFNFITLLAEGEAHACRKFPSPIGNVLEEGIEGVYESEAARRYRAGCLACRDCEIRPVCGGCLAVAHSRGLDPFTEKDPQCFINGGGTVRSRCSPPPGE